MGYSNLGYKCLEVGNFTIYYILRKILPLCLVPGGYTSKMGYYTKQEWLDDQLTRH